MFTQARGVSEGKAVWAEGIAIDFAEIEADTSIGGVDCIFELEDWLRNLASHLTDLDAAPIIGVLGIGFMERAGVGGDLGDTSAAWFDTTVTLAANVNVDGEATQIFDIGTTAGAGRGCKSGT